MQREKALNPFPTLPETQADSVIQISCALLYMQIHLKGEDEIRGCSHTASLVTCHMATNITGHAKECAVCHETQPASPSLHPSTPSWLTLCADPSFCKDLFVAFTLSVFKCTLQSPGWVLKNVMCEGSQQQKEGHQKSFHRSLLCKQGRGGQGGEEDNCSILAMPI